MIEFYNNFFKVIRTIKMTSEFNVYRVKGKSGLLYTMKKWHDNDLVELVPKK